MDVPQRPNWSPEAEQIETGTWQALAFNNDTLRATAAMPSSQPVGLSQLPTLRPLASNIPSSPIVSPTGATQSSPAQQSSANPLFAATQRNVDTPITPEQGKESSLTIQEKLDRFRAMEFAKNDSQVIVNQIAKIENAEPPIDHLDIKKIESGSIAHQQESTRAEQKSDTDLAPKISPVVSKKTDLTKDDLPWATSSAETDFAKSDVNNGQSSIPAPKISPIQKAQPIATVTERKDIEVAPKINSSQVTEKPLAAANPSESNGLFNLDDNAIDQLFSENLGVTERAFPANPKAAQNNSAPTPQLSLRETHSEIIDSSSTQSILNGLPQEELSPLSASSSLQHPTGAAGVERQAQSGKLFSIDDNMIDNIFSEQLGVTDKALDKTPKPIEIIETSIDTTAPSNSSPFKVEGIGRLDNRSDTTGDAVGAGKISAIGKFLLDGPDLEKIGKLAFADPTDTKMRILTMEAATELKSLLRQIDSQPGVVGSIILGHDQLLIVHTMPAEMDAESLGQLAFSVYMNTRNIANKMGYEIVQQLVSKTQKGYLIIANFGDGLLVTASDAQEVNKIAPLLNNINQLAIS
jgi:predicted regulator of Ras-like GTPase activity (Roadblock/LC7/MglB family)